MVLGVVVLEGGSMTCYEEIKTLSIEGMALLFECIANGELDAEEYDDFIEWLNMEVAE